MAHGKLLVISKKKQSLPKDRVPHRLESKLGEERGKSPKPSLGKAVVFLLTGTSPQGSVLSFGGAGRHLVHFTEKSMLSQQLVKSFNFLFLLLQKQTNNWIYLLSLTSNVDNHSVRHRDKRKLKTSYIPPGISLLKEQLVTRGPVVVAMTRDYQQRDRWHSSREGGDD